MQNIGYGPVKIKNCCQQAENRIYAHGAQVDE